MKKSIIGFAFLAILFLAACGSKNILLDNPGQDAVSFVFDGGDAVEVAAGAMTSISLEPGSHKLLLKNSQGQVLGDTSIQIKEGGIIHSGASNYVVWRQLYGMQAERETLLNEKWVEFDSVRAFGDIKVFPKNWLFVEKCWEKGLDEELPDAQSLYITKDYVIESKVFRSKEFVKTYRDMAKKSKEDQ